MIDLYLDAFRTEARIETAGGAGQVLISPFSSEQAASSHVRYHMPARFSKEVVRGIRHAAAKAFQVSLQLTLHTSVYNSSLQNKVDLILLAKHQLQQNWCSSQAAIPKCRFTKSVLQ